jgi:hypothetical protein
VRTVVCYSIAIGIFGLACASVPAAGPLGEGAAFHPRITAVDTTYPPKSVWVDMDQPGYAAVVLVAPGHSATLLYPLDSLTDNKLTAGAHLISLQVPQLLVQADSLRGAGPSTRRREPQDSSIRYPGRQRPDTSLRGRGQRIMPLLPSTPTFLLLVTSPQPLVFGRIVEKTAGVSIPSVETEALNAVAKAIKSTIPNEPREWAGYYQRVELRHPR